MNKVRAVFNCLLDFAAFLFGMTLPSERRAWSNWNHPPIAVLIPAFNEEEHIADTVKSCWEQTLTLTRVLVSDDCSTDRTAVVARQAGATVVTLPKNSGTKAGAQNYALRYIPDEWIVITIDADTKLDPKAIEHLVQPLADHNVASTCGYVIPQKQETIWELARYAQYLFGISIAKVGQHNFGGTLVSSGCFSAYHASLLKQYGGFPTRTMVEDMDLTWKQMLDGYKVILVPKAVCYPVEPENARIYIRQLDRWYRGFFQVVGLHGLKLWKNLPVLFFVLWSLIEGLLASTVILMPLVAVIRGGVALKLTLFSVIGLSIVSLSVLLESAKRGGLTKGIISLPCYFLVSIVDMYVFLRSFVLEWILRRRLTTWVKGH